MPVRITRRDALKTIAASAAAIGISSIITGCNIRVPLAGTWVDGGFWDASDYDGAESGELLPREGSIPLKLSAVSKREYVCGRGSLGVDASSSIRCDELAEILASGGSVTVIADVAPDVTNCPILAFSGAADAVYASLYINSMGNPALALRGSGATAKAGINRRVITGGRQIVACTISPTSITVYLDGLSGATKPHAIPLSGLSRASVGSWLSLHMTGRVRALAVAARELSIEEINEVRTHLHGRRLRVRVLGDSVAMGVGDGGPNNTDGRAGMRWLLSEWAAKNGIAMELVGQLDDGQWANTRHDGHAGNDIDRVRSCVASLPSTESDLVILICGGADLGWSNRPGYDPVTTPEKYRCLLDETLAKEPRATVLPSTVVPFNDALYPLQAAAGRDLNNKLIGVFAEVASRHPGRVIGWDGAGAIGAWCTEMFSILPDGAPDTHPSATGYYAMFRGNGGLLDCARRAWES